MLSATIDGSDYDNGHGVECYVSTVGGLTNLRIDARAGTSGLYSQLVLQYWNFSSYEKERDEDFDPPPPQVETFNLSATIHDGTDVYIYNAPSEFKDYLSLNPSCHTSFSSTGEEIAGTMTCVNLQNTHFDTVADITVKFSCERRSY